MNTTLGLKLGHDTPTAEHPSSPFVIAWALIQEKMESKQNLTEAEKLLIARVQIGKYLKSIREEKGIITAQITNLTESQIMAIELGGESYSIDDFLKLTQSLDVYFFLEDKESKHLDNDDMLSKAISPKRKPYNEK